MYANPDNFVTTDSGSAQFTYNSGLSATAKYYFGTSYTLDKNNHGHKLSGDIVQGTITSDKVGYYTCFSTNKDATCQRLFYTTKYNSSTSMNVSGVGYGTTSKEQSQSNDVNSEVKNYLENWYQNNLNNYSEKLSKDQYSVIIETFQINKVEHIQMMLRNASNNIRTREVYELSNQGILGPTLSCQANEVLV